MFKIVKYLNSVHSSFLDKKPVEECASELLKAIGKNFDSDNPAELLGFFRMLELND
jgi:hypothetical protein